MTSIKGHRKSLGVDIGGSSIKFCLIDQRSKSILDTSTVPHTSGTETNAIISEIMNQIKEWKFVGSLGIGFPGIVEEMVIVDAPNLGHWWNGFDFRTHFTHHEIEVVSVLNDADAAAVAMIEQTTSWQEQNILCLTIGTGIGSGWISKGQLLEGTEYGREYSPDLKCTLEQWAAAKVIDNENISMKEWVYRFSDILNILIQKYSPEAIVLSGGITKNEELWLPELQHLHSIPIAISGFSDYTGAYGAAIKTV